jgi:hypothetical protein
MPLHPVEPGKFTTRDLTQQNSVATYGFAVMSVVFASLAGESVRAGDIEFRGVAWNDGVVPLSEVRVSLDRGGSWQATQLEATDSPSAWHHWRTTARLQSGAQGSVGAGDRCVGAQPAHRRPHHLEPRRLGLARRGSRAVSGRVKGLAPYHRGPYSTD